MTISTYRKTMNCFLSGSFNLILILCIICIVSSSLLPAALILFDTDSSHEYALLFAMLPMMAVLADSSLMEYHPLLFTGIFSGGAGKSPVNAFGNSRIIAAQLPVSRDMMLRSYLRGKRAICIFPFIGAILFGIASLIKPVPFIVGTEMLIYCVIAFAIIIMIQRSLTMEYKRIKKTMIYSYIISVTVWSIHIFLISDKLASLSTAAFPAVMSILCIIIGAAAYALFEKYCRRLEIYGTYEFPKIHPGE